MGGRLAGILDELRALPRLDSDADRAAVDAEYTLVRQGLAWFQGREADLAGRLAKLAPVPEDAVAALSGRARRDVDRVLGRAATAEQVPVLGDALVAGQVSGEHVDCVTRALASLEPHERPVLAQRVAALVEVAKTATVEEFQRQVRSHAQQVRTAGGMGRLEQQRRACRVRTWVDLASGMYHLHARLDPDTGARLHRRLHDLTGTLFTDREPSECPSDPGEKQDYLRALAFVALTQGHASRPGRPELIAVWDITEPAAHPATAAVDADPPVGGSGPGDGAAVTDGPPVPPRLDWGIPVELPVELLEHLFPDIDVYPIILRGGVVLYAPGQVDLGRTTRLANRAQRRALRALYPTCAIPGCEVRFDNCKLHHVIWWRHGGPTNLHNLLPVCERHHHAIHDLGWQLTLTPNRTLTIHQPDGTITTTGPPHRQPR